MDSKWTIKSNYTYVIKFVRFDLESSTNCIFDYLQVDNQRKLCGTKTPFGILIDKARGTIHVTFHSDRGFHGKGFHMKIVKVKDTGKSSYC